MNRSLAIAALFLSTACGHQEVVRESRRSSLPLAGDANAEPNHSGDVMHNGANDSNAADSEATAGSSAGDQTDSSQSGNTANNPSDTTQTSNGTDNPDAPSPSPNAPPPVGPPSSFTAGLYFVKPDTTGKLLLQHNGAAVSGIAALPVDGFSLSETSIVTFEAGANIYNNRLVVSSPDGKMRRVIDLQNVNKPLRPVLSPDASAVAFEAHLVSGTTIKTRSDIFVLDLDTNAIKIVSQGGDAHVPLWFPITGRILYASGNTDGSADLVIVDPKDPSVYISMLGVNSVHVAISADENEILIPSSGRTYSAVFTPIGNLNMSISQGAKAAGLSSFLPISAAFAHDGSSIVLAGTVAPKNGVTNVVVAEIDRQGGNFKVLHGPFAMTPLTVANAKFLPIFLKEFP